MNNKETLNNYNGRLAKNNLDLVSVLETINNLPEAGGKGSSTFVQLKEPKATQGIWLQADAKEHDNFYMKYESNIYPTLVSSTSYPTATYGHGGAAIGRYIYTFGGLNSSYAKINVAYKYDVVENKFTTLATPPFYRHVPLVVAVGTDIYIIGGTGGTSSTTPESKLNWVHKYDTINNTYTRVADLPYSAHNIKGISIGTDIYIFGGSTTDAQNAYKYDTLTDTYTALKPTTYTVAGHGVVADDEYIYIFGGGQTSDGKYGILKYSIADNDYTFIQTEFGLGNGAIYKYGNYVYLAGGYDGVNGGSSNKIYKYNLLDNTYTIVGNLVTNLANFAYATVDNIMYILGGQTSNGASNYFQKKTLFPYDKPTIISTSKMWLYEDGEAVTDNVPTYINNNDKWELV